MSSNTTPNSENIESGSISDNVSTPNASNSVSIIKLGFIIVGSLAGSAIVLSVISSFREINPAVLALVSSTSSGILGFLAGRKK